MLRVGELLLLSAGIAVGAYGYLITPSNAPADLAAITRISAAPDRDYRNDAVISTFAPTAPSMTKVVADAGSENVTEIVKIVAPKPAAWTATVILSGQPVVSPIRSPRPADLETREQLTNDLQRELQRAGCYGGEINGAWTASTRRAMAAFMDRANAVLPYNQPDYVLLALVQSHREIACRADCDHGEVLSEGGRCLPRAVVAQAEKKSKRLEESRLATARLADERNRDVASAQPETLPWLKSSTVAAPSAEFALISPSGPRPDPLPGRMSIGGPPIDLALTPPASATASSAYEVPPRTPDGVSSTPPKYASLRPEDNTDDVANDGTAAQPAVEPSVAADADAPIHKSRKSKHSDRAEGRDGGPQHDSYSNRGRRRHGDPRPGTAQFNLAQSLGGVF